MVPKYKSDSVTQLMYSFSCWFNCSCLIFGMQMRPFMCNHPEAFGRTAQTERKQHMITLDLWVKIYWEDTWQKITLQHSCGMFHSRITTCKVEWHSGNCLENIEIAPMREWYRNLQPGLIFALKCNGWWCDFATWARLTLLMSGALHCSKLWPLWSSSS